MDTTNTFTTFFSDEDTHVSRFTPPTTPRVTHDPELLVVFDAPAHDVDRVVELITAVFSVENAAFVELEDVLF